MRDIDKNSLVLCRSDTGDGGWSLHAPGSTNEQIACGDSPPLISGTSGVDADGTAREPLDCVRVSRIEHAAKGTKNCRVTATDGKILADIRWQEENWEEFPKIEGISAQPVDGYVGLIPAMDCVEAAKSVPKRALKPILKHVVLDEENSKNGTATLATYSLDSTSKKTVKTSNKAYPDIDPVFPNSREEGKKVLLSAKNFSRLWKSSSRQPTHQKTQK